MYELAESIHACMHECFKGFSTRGTLKASKVLAGWMAGARGVLEAGCLFVTLVTWQQEFPPGICGFNPLNLYYGY